MGNGGARSRVGGKVLTTRVANQRAKESEGLSLARAKEALVQVGLQGEVEYTGKHGIVRVVEVGEEGYRVLHFAGRYEQRVGAGDSRAVPDTAAVNTRLREIGYSNTFDYGMLHGDGPVVQTGAKGNKGTGTTAGPKGQKKPAAISRGADWLNARPGAGVGRYDLSIGDHDVEMERIAGDGFRLRSTDRMANKTTEGRAATSAEAIAALRQHGASEVFARTFVRMANHDVHTYVESTPTKAQQARINATQKRAAALDAKYGSYSEDHVHSAVRSAYNRVPGLEDAIYSHLIGGSYLSADAALATLREERDVSATEARAIPGALRSLREISEWSLLHSANVTREGTVRLWHGANGESSPATWRERLSAGTLRATPFTTNWRVAESFAEKSPHGRLLVSAQVPVSSVLVWHGISQSASWAEEQEYTVGGGKMSDFEVLKLPGKGRSKNAG